MWATKTLKYPLLPGYSMVGTIVAAGTPEEVAKCEQSYTGRYLRDILTKEGRM